MSSLDLDLDTHMNRLEFEWRKSHEASIIARAEYQALSADFTANAEQLDAARERLVQAEAAKSRVVARIERLDGQWWS